MTEHPTGQELEQYWRHELAPATFLVVHRHVVACPHCADQSSPEQQANDLEDLRAALVESESAEAEPYHLSAAEVVAYRRGELSEIDLEIAESHFLTCTRCRDETQLPEAPLVDHTPADENPVLLSPGWKTRVEAFGAWRVAAAVLGGAILILLALFMFRSKPANNSVRTNPAPSVGPHEPDSLPDNSNESRPAPTTDPGAQLIVSLDDGGERITLDSQGELKGLERLPANVRQTVKEALRAARVERPPVMSQLNARPSTLLGQSDNGQPFQLRSPVGQVVASERPLFSWSPLAGAHSYTVSVTDSDLNEVATSPPLVETKWHVPKSLKPGAIYSWQVTALKDGKPITSPVLPAPQAKFKVVDGSTMEKLRQVKSTYGSSHLAAGVLYAEAGLFVEAERELRELVKANPRDRAAREILHSVQLLNQGSPAGSGRHHRSSPIKIKPAQ